MEKTLLIHYYRQNINLSKEDKLHTLLKHNLHTRAKTSHQSIISNYFFILKLFEVDKCISCSTHA